MATIITKSIKATGGDYSTIAGWEAGQQGNLPTLDEIHVGECYNETYAENVVIDGSITDATRYMKLSVASGERHDGTQSTGAVVNPSASGHAFTVSDDYTQIEWIKITSVQSASNEGIRINANNCLFRNLIIHDLSPADSDGIYMGLGSYTVTIENVIIHDLLRAGLHAQPYQTGYTQVWNIRNCTLVNCGDVGETESGGINVASASGSDVTVNVSNTIAVDTPSTYEDFSQSGGVETWAGSNNLTSDTSASRGGLTGGLETRTVTASSSPGAGDWVIFTNITAGSQDFHLQDNVENDAQDAGTDLSAYFTDDIDDDTRPQNSVYEIGADEIVVEAAVGIISQRLLIGQGI